VPSPRKKTKQADNTIVVRGAREHNLKDISIDIPRDKMIVFTGLSGSGKSSLAFDTIYAEGQRRYVESLSSYARQFLGQMDKPDVDFIEGLSPAISIDQKTGSKNPRSTVGTVTEIYDYLRLLYARVGTPHCPQCGAVVSRQTPQQIVDRVLDLDEGTRFLVLAPVVRGRKGQYESLLDELASKGFARVRIDGEVLELADRAELTLARYEAHTIEVVVDRLIARPDIRQRLTESMETALSLADGLAEVLVVDTAGEIIDQLTFSEHLACVACSISFAELAPRNFSFNSPYGACDYCDGLGTHYEVDPSLVVPDPAKSISNGAILPWTGFYASYHARSLAALAANYNIDLTAPYSKLTKVQQKLIMQGTGSKALPLTYTNRRGQRRTINAHYEGVANWLLARRTNASSDAVRENAESYMREVECPSCNGARLSPTSLAVTVADLNIFDLCSLSLKDAALFIESIELSERDHLVADRVLKEIRERTQFLLDVGLDYLSLARNGHSFGRRGPENTTGQSDRKWAGWCPLCTRRAFYWPAPKRQCSPAGHTHSPARSGKHRHCRRAR